MYILDNPVMQRELLVNLRTPRAFVLLLLYQCILAAVVYYAWPQGEERRVRTSGAEVKGRVMVDTFLISQFILASMMAPSFAAGAITGEKERKTYEMLLASPLRPLAIVLGKMVASLTHIGVLVFSSLPIVMLCLPMGGVSIYELLAGYLALMMAVITFGAISIACSSYFQRTVASLVVSYLLILPLAMISVLFWQATADAGAIRLAVTVTMLPAVATVITIVLIVNTSARLLHPSDVGSEGKEVVDLEEEAQQAVGLVIQRDQFPDRLFAPPKRETLMEDNANPVYDKEIRSEIFSQGTLMLRLVIQVSMLLAIPLMAICLYIAPENAQWYISYVVLFNMLVGPVFSAGSVSSERERQTLDLLLTTVITPWQILSGKLIAGLRVSSVLTMFLLWPVLLALIMVWQYWTNVPSILTYVGIVLLTCVTTATVALFTSVIFRKTSTSLVVSYLVVVAIFCVPLATKYFAYRFPNKIDQEVVTYIGLASPFVAAWNVPLDVEYSEIAQRDELEVDRGSWTFVGMYAAITIVLNLFLLSIMSWLFNQRWRVSQ